MNKSFIPKESDVLNIDLEYYKFNENKKIKNQKQIRTFVFTFIFTIICYSTVFVIEKFKFNLNPSLKTSLSIISAIALIFCLKSICQYIFSKIASWEIAAGKIISIEENNNQTTIEVEFTTNKTQEKITFSDTFNFSITDAIKSLELNSLPVIYHSSRYKKGIYYIDLKFHNGILETYNLVNKEHKN
jgi:hypothetical protein